jgi:hypothetical protein
MGRRFLAIALALVVINFLWLSNSADHVKVGLIWLVVDLALWLPDLKELEAKL